VCKFLLLSTFFYCPLPYRCSGVSVAKHASHVCFWNRIDIFHPSGGSKSAVLGDAVGKGAKSQRKESADREVNGIFAKGEVLVVVAQHLSRMAPNYLTCINCCFTHKYFCFQQNSFTQKNCFRICRQDLQRLNISSRPYVRACVWLLVQAVTNRSELSHYKTLLREKLFNDKIL